MDILLESEATELLRLPKGTLPHLRRIGGGPVFATLGTHIVYRREDLEAWVLDCITNSIASGEEAGDE